MRYRGKEGIALAEGSISKRLFKDMAKIKIGLAFGVLLSAAVIVCNIYAPKMLSEIIDELNLYRMARQNGTEYAGNLTEVVARPLILLSALYIGYSLMSYLKMQLMNRVVSTHFTCTMRIKLSDKIARMPVSFVDRVQPGEVLSRMTNDVSQLGNSVHTITDLVVMGLLQLAAITAMMFSINWILAVVVVGIAPFSMFLSAKLSKRSDKYYDKMFKASGELYSVVEESYGGFETIKSYNLENSRLNHHNEHNNDFRVAACKADYLSTIVQPIIGFLNSLAYIAICLIGGYLSIKGSITVGAVVAVVLYSKMFSGPLEQIAFGISSFQRVKSAGRRVYGMLEEPEMEVLTEKLPQTAAEGVPDVEFDNVCFEYIKDHPVIQNLNLKVTSGKKVAIVGPTGAGKTTIVNLLMRFYDPVSGKILIKGNDSASYSRESVRDMFSMVLQDTWLFGGTIFDNVAYGKENVTREEVEMACDKAYADHFIRTLPEGYSTVIDENCTNLSGGQKQLLTISRAFLSEKEFLILDEATSNVDTRTEVLIQKAMDKLMKNKTCFIIAHRLSTIVNADNILVINDGHIVETGTHKELLAAKGFYYQMYNSQYAV